MVDPSADAVDHEEPVVLAGDVLLDEDVPEGPCPFECPGQLFLSPNLRRHSLPEVGGVGLHDHRISDVRHELPCLIERGDTLVHGHRKSQPREDLRRGRLRRREHGRQVRRALGEHLEHLGLAASIAETVHRGMIGEPCDGNTTAGRFEEDPGGVLAGPELAECGVGLAHQVVDRAKGRGRCLQGRFVDRLHGPLGSERGDDGIDEAESEAVSVRSVWRGCHEFLEFQNRPAVEPDGQPERGGVQERGICGG